ncbi:MAG: PilZ domain-containing protein [Treponema sp.]|jgi:hypothetical protein|nr:PilZ domain-containing protein [Treponema sp.]
MKLMLVLGSDEIPGVIEANIKPLGLDLIRYRHVLKAMDNIDEIDPAGIIISADDFPRHWKALIQFVRYERSGERCPVILLTGENFSLEEASQAFCTGISGIVSGSLNRPDTMNQLQNLLKRRLAIRDNRKARRYRAEPWTRLGFYMVHPVRKAIVTTAVKTLSSTGVLLEPDNPGMTADLADGTVLAECSLRVGDDIISPVCRLIRRQPGLSMQFVSLDKVEQIILESYLENIPLQEAKIHTG